MPIKMKYHIQRVNIGSTTDWTDTLIAFKNVDQIKWLI